VIAADTSSLIAFFSGANGDDVGKIANALRTISLYLPPVAITELLSDAHSRANLLLQIADCPQLEILPGYWERAGVTRSIVLAKGLAAKVPDTLIAQSCIDHNVELITRDTDFRHFAKHCGLKLA
jgi:predicted nucleic acid-binding protein